MATHGEPNKVNTYPHYSPLRQMLIQNEFEFRSTTDTEVLVQLIEFERESEECDLLTAVRIALRSVVGSYAIAIIEHDKPDTIIAARKNSPLVVGVGDGEFLIASDASAIIEYTSSVIV